MPDDNRIDAEITAAVKTQILTKFQEILDLLPMRVNLTPQEKQSIPSLGPARTGMVPVFIQVMQAHPELVPSYVNVPLLLRDQALLSALNELFGRSSEVTESLKDTAHVAGADMYLAFLAVWNNVKEARRRNVPGIDAIYDLLKPFFTRTSPEPTPTTPGGPNP